VSAGYVDYDRIAATYDRRFVNDRQDGVAAALLTLAQEVGVERVLEVGCGTGRYLADFHPLAHQLCGLDLSAGMLGNAREREAAFRLVRGRGGQLPYPDGAFDLVYCVNAIHHFDRSEPAASRWA
jgi:ubiquinone/menaquinone biosynthesis C-methylase UbiE